jgi:hypothetical protein
MFRSSQAHLLGLGRLNTGCSRSGTAPATPEPPQPRRGRAAFTTFSRKNTGRAESTCESGSGELQSVQGQISSARNFSNPHRTPLWQQQRGSILMRWHAIKALPNPDKRKASDAGCATGLPEALSRARSSPRSLRRGCSGWWCDLTILSGNTKPNT